jgi:hypothetical protein
MRHQDTLRHASRIRVVQPFYVEPGQSRFDPVGDRQVGDEAAAVDPDKIAGQFG